jgi:hypothetical protein
VLTGTNVTQLNSMGFTGLDLMTNRYVSFLATAGTTYNIRLMGTSFGSYAFRLVVTDSPWIFTNPQTRSVSTNEPALFTVVAGGAKPLTYQWRHAGTNLPGETAVALAVLGATPDQAGPYSVIVSNLMGASESLAAQLYVSLAPVRPYLSVLGPVANGRLTLALTGEIGRSYRIETSPDLVSWTSETSFSASRYCCTSVVINSNTTSVYSVPWSPISRFLRAAHYPAVHKNCAMYLQHIWFANAQFARESPKHFLSPVTETDIRGYFKAGFCYGNYDHGSAFADTYAISTVIGPPQCQVFPATDRLEGPD